MTQKNSPENTTETDVSDPPNWRRQLSLALALFILSGAVYWLEFRHRPDREAKVEQSRRIFALKDVSVPTMKLSDGRRVVEFSCQDMPSKLCRPGDNSKWQLSVPVKVRADDANTNSLLSQLDTLAAAEIIELKEETDEKRAALLREYGLDPASLATTRNVEVTTSTGKLALHVGMAHPIGDSLYAALSRDGKLDETRVFLVPAFFKATFDHDITYWRDKKLLAINSHEVNAFKLENSRGRVAGERKGGNWILTMSAGAPPITGDPENIDGLITAATYITAKGFPSDDKTDARAKAALTGIPQALTLTFATAAGGPPTVLTLFQKKSRAKGPNATPTPGGRVLATVSTLDPLFELDPSYLERLDKDPKDLRLTKLLSSMERYGAKRLSFKGPKTGEIRLANAEGKWIFEGANAKGAASQEKVQNTLDKLSGNRVQAFLKGASIPSGDHEGVEVRVGDEKDAGKRQFLFWKNGSKLYARDLLSKGVDEAFLVDPAIEAALPWDPAFFQLPKEAAPIAKPKAKK